MSKQIALLPHWAVFLILVGAMAAGSFLPIRFSTALLVIIYAGWVLALGFESNRLLPIVQQKSIQKVKLALLYTICYVIVGGAFIDTHKGGKGILVLFHLFAMFCIFLLYVFYCKEYPVF